MHKNLRLFIIAIGVTMTLSAWGETPSNPETAGSHYLGSVDVSMGGGVAPSYKDDRSLLAAPKLAFSAGGEVYLFPCLPLRGELSLFGVGASAMDSSLFSYRAFWGLRLAAQTGGRMRFDGFTIELLAGAAISASEDSGTSLVSAHLSAVAEPRVLVPLSVKGIPGFSMVASLPLEYMKRADTDTYSAGINLGVCVELGKAAVR